MLCYRNLICVNIAQLCRNLQRLNLRKTVTLLAFGIFHTGPNPICNGFGLFGPSLHEISSQTVIAAVINSLLYGEHDGAYRILIRALVFP